MCVCVPPFLFLFGLWPYYDEMTQCCHLLHESANELVAGHSLGCWFFVWVCFWFVLLVFVCLFCWFAFACLSCGDDGLLDYVQVLHQFSFVALNSRWPRILICNYCFCNAIESVKRPGGSHEGVGRKKIHWRDPVALSVGQPGAPVSSKDCAHGSNVLLRSRWHPGGPLGG